MASPLGKGQKMTEFISEQMKAAHPKMQAKTQKPAEGALATLPDPVPAAPPKLTDISPNRAERRPSDAQRQPLKPNEAVDRLYTAFDKLNTLTEQAKAPDSRLQILGKALNQAWQNIKANPKKFIAGCLIVGGLIALTVVTGGAAAPLAILAGKSSLVIGFTKAAFGVAAGIAAAITGKYTVFNKGSKVAPKPFDPKKDLTQLAGALDTLRDNLGKAKLEYSDAAQYVQWYDYGLGKDGFKAQHPITGENPKPETYLAHKAKLNKADLPKEHALLENTAKALNDMISDEIETLTKEQVKLGDDRNRQAIQVLTVLSKNCRFEGDKNNINDIIKNGEKLQTTLDGYVKFKVVEASRGLENATHAQQQELRLSIESMNNMLPENVKEELSVPPPRQEAEPELPPPPPGHPEGVDDAAAAPAASKKTEVTEEPPPAFPNLDDEGDEILPPPEHTLEEELQGSQPAAAAPAAASAAGAASAAVAPKAAAAAIAAPKPAPAAAKPEKLLTIQDCKSFDKLEPGEREALRGKEVYIADGRNPGFLKKVLFKEIYDIGLLQNVVIELDNITKKTQDFSFDKVYVPKEK